MEKVRLHKNLTYIWSMLLIVLTPPTLGRAWLNLTLNEQVMESYLRMFIENQLVLQDYYSP